MRRPASWTSANFLLSRVNSYMVERSRQLHLQVSSGRLRECYVSLRGMYRTLRCLRVCEIDSTRVTSNAPLTCCLPPQSYSETFYLLYLRSKSAAAVLGISQYVIYPILYVVWKYQIFLHDADAHGGARVSAFPIRTMSHQSTRDPRPLMRPLQSPLTR